MSEAQKFYFFCVQKVRFTLLFFIAATLTPNKCDQTARTEKGHKKREKRDRKRGENQELPIGLTAYQ